MLARPGTVHLQYCTCTAESLSLALVCAGLHRGEFFMLMVPLAHLFATAEKPILDR